MATDGPGRGPEPSVRKEVRPVTSARLVVFCCCRTVGQSMWRDRHPSPTRHYKRITSRSCRRPPVGPGAGGIGIPHDGHPEAAELTGDHGRPQPRDLRGQRYYRTFRAVLLCAADRDPGAGDGLQQPEGSANGYARAREPCEQRSMRPPTLTDGGEIHSITLSWRLLPPRTEPCAAVAIRRPDARGLSDCGSITGRERGRGGGRCTSWLRRGIPRADARQLHHERSGCRRGAALGRLSGSASEDSREGWVSVAPGPPVVQEPHSKRRQNDVTVVRPPEGPALA